MEDFSVVDENLTVTLTPELARRVRQVAAELGITTETLLARAAERSVVHYEHFSQLHHVAAIGLRLFQGKRLGTGERGLAEQFQLRTLLAHLQGTGLPVTLDRIEQGLREYQDGGQMLPPPRV